jgi:hypothetical protein
MEFKNLLYFQQQTTGIDTVDWPPKKFNNITYLRKIITQLG